MKVQAERAYKIVNGHIIGFRPQTQKLELPHKTLSNTLAVKGLMRKTSNLASMNMCTVCVVVQCNPWFKFYFPFSGVWRCMIMRSNKGN